MQMPERADSKEIMSVLSGAKGTDELLETASELLSDITQYAGVIMLPHTETAKLRQVEFLELSEERVLAILVTDDGRVQNRVLFLDKKLSASELVEAQIFQFPTRRQDPAGGAASASSRHAKKTATR